MIAVMECQTEQSYTLFKKLHIYRRGNSSMDVEGGRASDITAVSLKNVREKYSYTPGEQHSDQLSAQLNVG